MNGRRSKAAIAVALAVVIGMAGASSATAVSGPIAAEIAPLNLVGEPVVDRSTSEQHGKSRKHNGVPAPTADSSAVGGSNATVSFNGANMFDQRTLNGFYLEPPDQGLCVSHAAAPGGRALEVVNDVMAVYDFAGTQLKKQTLNQMFGYPPLLSGGPEMTDPSCYYDEDTGAWIAVALTLELGPHGGFTGANHLDIAVSNPLNHDPATTTWKVYKFPVQNNGTQGTPNHNCEPSPGPLPPDVVYPDACVGDYPHIGADKYGFYVTTNEYAFFGDAFNSAQIYVFSKAALAENATDIPMAQFANTSLEKEKRGPVGFTIWPAVVPDTAYNLDNGGTEFFLSSTAGEESGNQFGSSDTIGLWAITNTQSIDSPHPDLRLSSRALDSEAYSVPPLSDQPHSGQTSGDDFPLGQCLNFDPCATFLNGGVDRFKPEVIGQLDSNDTRMQQVYYAAGKVWGALDTRVVVGGEERAGVAYFIVDPVMIGNGGQHVGPQSSIVKQGYLAVANNNVIYPAVAVNTAGQGAMAFTLVGPDYYPTAADILIGLNGTEGPIFVAGQGVGLQDGFSEYKYYAPVPPNIRPRWGDYGAADEDAGSIWIASEFIGQRCTFAQYTASTPFGSCGGTRRALGNWYTRISHVTP